MNASRPLENAIDVSAATIAVLPRAKPSQISIECYENDVPCFADKMLQQLYGSLFSSLAHGRIYDGLGNVSTYVERDGEAVVCIWLFRREGRQVRVLNEGISLGRDEVERFVRHVFDAYPSVHAVSFHAVQPQQGLVHMPHQRYNCLEDTVLPLPRNAADYRAGLGKSTRSYLNRYLNKLKRDFPDFQFQTFAAHQIDPQQIWRIIEFNRSRMQIKGKISRNDDDSVRRIIRLAQKCGMVCIITIGGRICAGTINYRVGDNFFLEALAHDPAYNDYRLGTLCCYLTVCECIARGGNEYHFLWGQDEYKTRLGGVQRDLEHLVYYRSHLHMLASGRIVLDGLLNAWKRKARLWLRAARRDNTFSARVAAALLQTVRSMR